MKLGLDLTISRLGGYLAQLEQGHVPCSQTEPFQEALATLESPRAVQEEPHTKKKALSARVSADSANSSADQAPRIEAEPPRRAISSIAHFSGKHNEEFS